jgi:hypothetical protein
LAINNLGRPKLNLLASNGKRVARNACNQGTSERF